MTQNTSGPTHPCYNVCCCGEFKSKALGKTRAFGGAITVLAVLTVVVIGASLAGVYFHKAIGLNTGVNPASVAKWAEAAKWTGVIGGSSIGIMIASKIADVCNSRFRKHHRNYQEIR